EDLEHVPHAGRLGRLSRKDDAGHGALAERDADARTGRGGREAFGHAVGKRATDRKRKGDGDQFRVSGFGFRVQAPFPQTRSSKLEARNPVLETAGLSGGSSSSLTNLNWWCTASQRYRRLGSSFVSGVITIESRSTDRSPSASEMSRSRNVPSSKPPSRPAKMTTENQGLPEGELRRTNPTTRSSLPSSL